MEDNKNTEKEIKEDKKEAPAKEPTAEEKLAELEKKLAEYDDKYLRMAAEYDNFRRRAREERDAVYENAACDTIAQLLPIVDNLERAALYQGDKVSEGLAMITKSVGEVLAKLGVESFGAVGDIFDPNLHNAVMHEENDSAKDGEITEVFQKGYKKGKHIIRFAMVKTVN